MKNKNQRELEKYWTKEATKKAKPGKKKIGAREDRNKAAREAAGQSTEK